jgi:hypothetical protein
MYYYRLHFQLRVLVSFYGQHGQLQWFLFAIIEFLVDRLTLSEARVGSEISSKVAYALMSSNPVSGQLQTVRELIGSVNTDME